MPELEQQPGVDSPVDGGAAELPARGHHLRPAKFLAKTSTLARYAFPADACKRLERGTHASRYSI
jgi:hypothetical protein